MHRRFLPSLGIVLISAGAVRAQIAAPALDDLERRAEIVRPAADELKWQRIPWMQDLAEGQGLAREEQRPIFLWVTGDDPLERC